MLQHLIEKETCQTFCWPKPKVLFVENVEEKEMMARYCMFLHPQVNKSKPLH